MNLIHKMLKDLSLNLIPTETLVFSLYLGKLANRLFTYFCDFGPKSQKIDPQKTVLDKSIAKISSAKYDLKAMHKS